MDDPDPIRHLIAPTSDWGPLAALIGDWEGNDGLDVAYSHPQQRIVRTPYRERASFTPFGPVRNGSQRLFGLDYRTAMWRGDDAVPFHAEVGYWLWDPDSGEILRAFVVPRGISVLAGGTADAPARQFALAADLDSAGYSISENQYLTKRASSLSYRATITTHADGTWSYHEVTTLQMSELPEPLPHADQNTLSRVA